MNKFARLAALAIVSSTLYGQSNSQESGTLNIAFVLHDTVYLLADSGITAFGKTQSLPNFKSIDIGPTLACAVEGHEDDIDLKHNGRRMNVIPDALRRMTRKVVAGDLDLAFSEAERITLTTLEDSNRWAVQQRVPLLRHYPGDDVHYRRPSGRLYVTGIICMGLHGGKPAHREAHFETDAAGKLYQVEDRAEPVEQGDVGLLTSLAKDRSWPARAKPPYPEPTFPSFLKAYSELQQTFLGWQGLSPETALDIMSGVYWSTMASDCGVVSPPIVLRTLHSGTSRVAKSVLKVPKVPSCSPKG